MLESVELEENDFNSADSYGRGKGSEEATTLCKLLKLLKPEGTKIEAWDIIPRNQAREVLTFHVEFEGVHLEAYLLEKKKLDGPPERQIEELATVLGHDPVLRGPERVILLRYIPLVRRLADDLLQFRLKEWHVHDGSAGNVLWTTLSTGIGFDAMGQPAASARGSATFRPMELEDLPGRYLLVHVRTVSAAPQKASELVPTLDARLQAIGARPRNGLLEKAVAAEARRVLDTNTKYGALSVVVGLGSLVVCGALIGAIRSC